MKNITIEIEDREVRIVTDLGGCIEDVYVDGVLDRTSEEVGNFVSDNSVEIEEAVAYEIRKYETRPAFPVNENLGDWNWRHVGE